MAKQKNIYRVPVAIRAADHRTLVKEMLKNNQEDDKEYEYFCISREGNLWYAWYYKDIKPKQEI